MNNIKYFDYSLKNEDNEDDIRKILDPKGVVVISQEKKNKLMKEVEKLEKLITKYYNIKKVIIEKDEQNTILDEIIKIIETSKENINYTPFAKYFLVLGYSFSKVKNIFRKIQIDEKRELMEYLLDMYIKNRYEIYKELGYTHSILQIMADEATSKRYGAIGLKALKKILEPLGFVYVEKKEDFEKQDYCFINTDKKGKKLFDKILEEKKVDFTYKKDEDNKYSDMLIKIKQNYFILEHKLTNGVGGLQNLEIREIIKFIEYDEKKAKKIHYVSCLQGDFFKNLNSDATKKKNVGQRKNIIETLKKHPDNYFINGKGLEKLVKDYMER